MMAGFELMDILVQTVERLATSCDWFVLSGTLPVGIPTTTYTTLITMLKQYNKKIVLDTSRDALKEGVLAGPTIVKPNIDELRQLTGLPLADDADLERTAHQLLEGGVQLVVIS